MRSLRRQIKGETGQSSIILALSLVMLCAFAAMVVDIGMLDVNKGQLQTAADAAALAAAYELPDASAAQNTAIHYAELNGAEAANVTVTTPYNGDPKKVEVVCSETVEYSFARVLGFTSKEVSARAVAEKTGMDGGPFVYAVFHGNTSSGFQTGSSNLYIDGSVHSNNSVLMNGSTQTITGNAEAVTSFAVHGSTITIGGLCQGYSITKHGSKINIPNVLAVPAAVIDMPDLSAEAISEAQAGGTTYSGYTQFNGSHINLDTPVYVDGSIHVSGSTFSGQGILLATGDIQLSGSSHVVNANDSVCIYSKNGDIQINGSSIEVHGVLYAPNGSIQLSGASITIYGRVIGKKVQLNGSNIQVISGENDLNFLPGSSVRLVE